MEGTEGERGTHYGFVATTDMMADCLEGDKEDNENGEDKRDATRREVGMVWW